MLSSDITYIVCEVLAFVPAIVLHEVSHGFAAYKLGDPTAKNAGRLTLNPAAHIDPFGTVVLPAMMMLVGGPVFGYAKPVPYNPRYFEDKRKGDLIVGLAGPAANLAQALVGAAIAWGVVALDAAGLLAQGVVASSLFQAFFWVFLPMYTLINLYLMFFNLLPIPPLDGSSIFAFILPEKYLPQYYKVEAYAMPILLLVLFALPYLVPVSPISVYMDATAGNLANLIYPFQIS